jgi:hypothetical protein
MSEEDESFRDEKGKFKKQNLFSKGLENNGRPPIYEDPNVMAEKLAEYLDYEDRMKGTKHKGVYTLEGACLFLGFASRQSMHDYEERSSDFSYVINRFRLFMTHWNVQKLYWGHTFSGSQFWLRNFGGYTDESTVKQHQTVTTVQPTIVGDSPKLANDEKQIDI